MKIHSPRGTWTVEGKQVYTISANRPLNEREVESLYSNNPPDGATEPSPYVRVVVLEPIGRFVVVPLTPFVELSATTEDT